jgi:guanine deaminase
MHKGCDIYNRAPRPMCTSAIYWSRIDHLYFSASLEDTSHIRFSDEFQYQDFTLPKCLSGDNLIDMSRL